MNYTSAICIQHWFGYVVHVLLLMHAWRSLHLSSITLLTAANDMLQCDDQTHHHGIDHIHLELVDNVTKGGAGKNSVLKCDDQAHLEIDHGRR